jgi:hypothetical protein
MSKVFLPDVYKSNERHLIEVRLYGKVVATVRRFVWHRQCTDMSAFAYCWYKRQVVFLRFDESPNPYISLPL